MSFQFDSGIFFFEEKTLTLTQLMAGYQVWYSFSAELLLNQKTEDQRNGKEKKKIKKVIRVISPIHLPAVSLPP